MRILVVSDIHANLVAFDAVRAAAQGCDALWNLGDTIGYGPCPGACIDLTSSLGADPTLAGNHDLACIGRLNLDEFNSVAQIAARWTASQLTAEQRGYLEQLPSMTVSGGYTLAHGSPRYPIWEYISSEAVANANFACFDTAVCFVGHTHVAMVARLATGSSSARPRPLDDGQTIDLGEARYLINPGSVGQPRDRDPRAAYAILDTTQGTVTAHRVEYEIAETQRQMARAGLPKMLITRLNYGV